MHAFHVWLPRRVNALLEDASLPGAEWVEEYSGRSGLTMPIHVQAQCIRDGSGRLQYVLATAIPALELMAAGTNIVDCFIDGAWSHYDSDEIDTSMTSGSSSSSRSGAASVPSDELSVFPLAESWLPTDDVFLSIQIQR